MTERKHHNSILVLATLGVYLGLVLAGATPQILAQKNLNDAIAFQRNVGLTCPNLNLINGEKEEEINPFQYELAQRIIELYEATQIRLEITKAGQPELLGDYSFFFEHRDYSPYINKKGEVVDDFWEGEYSEWASAAHAGQMVELSSHFLTPLSDCTKPTTEKSLLQSSRLEIDDVELRLEMGVSKASESRAIELSKELRELFEKRRIDSADRAIKSIYESTEVRSEKNRLIIITRLPRAGLDALLAKDVK